MTVETTPATYPTVDATPISAAEKDQQFAELCATPPLSWPAVVMFGFGGGSQDVSVELLTLDHAIGQFITTVVATAVLIVGQNGCARGTSHVSTHHKFNHEHLAFFADGYGWVGGCNEVIGNDVLRFIKPPLAGEVENLTFKRNCCQNAVECT